MVEIGLVEIKQIYDSLYFGYHCNIFNKCLLELVSANRRQAY